MPISLVDTVENIVQQLQDRVSPEVGITDAWAEIVSDIAINRGLAGRYCNIIEEEINKYLDRLSESDKRNIWEETEAGELNRDNAGEIYIDSITMDLDVALFEEITKYAWDEVERIHREES